MLYTVWPAGKTKCDDDEGIDIYSTRTGCDFSISIYIRPNSKLIA